MIIEVHFLHGNEDLRFDNWKESVVALKEYFKPLPNTVNPNESG